MGTLDFLMSRRMQRVLGKLLLHADQSYSVSDLIRTSGGGRGATQKLLETLHEAGVVTDMRLGNQRLFTINQAHPVYPELRSMGFKTFGLADVIRVALTSIADRIELAFVFGSLADGTERSTSDIDLLVVGDVDLFEISPLLSEAEKDLGRPIHVNLVDPAQWADWQHNTVVEAIVNGPKIMVIGNEYGRTDRKFDPHRTSEASGS